ncbi:MAG: hypothetical protein RB191_20790 [Terriglobia bacterium]|nr:hypothetical protein [Terriglobia bacterium]
MFGKTDPFGGHIPWPEKIWNSHYCNKETPMQRVSFSLPLHRFEAADNMATRAALRQALGVSDNQLSDMIADALAHHQLVLNFRVTPEQFTKFLIIRNDVGCGNFFAEMKPRIYDADAPIANKRIVDFTRPHDDVSFRIHDDLPQSFVDRQNEKRAAWAGRRWPFGTARGDAAARGSEMHEAITVALDAANAKHSAQMTRMEAENKRLSEKNSALVRLCHNAASKLSSVLVRMKNLRIINTDFTEEDVNTAAFVKTLWNV